MLFNLMGPLLLSTGLQTVLQKSPLHAMAVWQPYPLSQHFLPQ